jgi:hypothetical protein
MDRTSWVVSYYYLAICLRLTWSSLETITEFLKTMDYVPDYPFDDIVRNFPDRFVRVTHNKYKFVKLEEKDFTKVEHPFHVSNVLCNELFLPCNKDYPSIYHFAINYISLLYYTHDLNWTSWHLFNILVFSEPPMKLAFLSALFLNRKIAQCIYPSQILISLIDDEDNDISNMAALLVCYLEWLHKNGSPATSPIPFLNTLSPNGFQKLNKAWHFSMGVEFRTLEVEL